MYYQDIGNLSLCVVSVGAETVSIEPGIKIIHTAAVAVKDLLTINPGPRLAPIYKWSLLSKIQIQV